MLLLLELLYFDFDVSNVVWAVFLLLICDTFLMIAGDAFCCWLLACVRWAVCRLSEYFAWVSESILENNELFDVLLLFAVVRSKYGISFFVIRIEL